LDWIGLDFHFSSSFSSVHQMSSQSGRVFRKPFRKSPQGEDANDQDVSQLSTTFSMLRSFELSMLDETSVSNNNMFSESDKPAIQTSLNSRKSVLDLKHVITAMDKLEPFRNREKRESKSSPTSSKGINTDERSTVVPTTGDVVRFDDTRSVSPTLQLDAVLEQICAVLNKKQVEKEVEAAVKLVIPVTSTVSATLGRSEVFMDFEIDGSVAGRVVFELFDDLVPITTENFRCLCTHEKVIETSTASMLL
jgi:hypothetical protein